MCCKSLCFFKLHFVFLDVQLFAPNFRCKRTRGRARELTRSCGFCRFNRRLNRRPPGHASDGADPLRFPRIPFSPYASAAVVPVLWAPSSFPSHSVWLEEDRPRWSPSDPVPPRSLSPPREGNLSWNGDRWRDAERGRATGIVILRASEPVRPRARASLLSFRDCCELSITCWQLEISERHKPGPCVRQR